MFAVAFSHDNTAATPSPWSQAFMRRAVSRRQMLSGFTAGLHWLKVRFRNTTRGEAPVVVMPPTMQDSADAAPLCCYSSDLDGAFLLLADSRSEDHHFNYDRDGQRVPGLSQ